MRTTGRRPRTVIMAGAAPQGPVAPRFWRPTTGRFDATPCLDASCAPPSAAVPPPVPARGPGQLSATTRSTTDGQLRFYSLRREAACVMHQRLHVSCVCLLLLRPGAKCDFDEPRIRCLLHCRQRVRQPLANAFERVCRDMIHGCCSLCCWSST